MNSNGKLCSFVFVLRWQSILVGVIGFSISSQHLTAKQYTVTPTGLRDVEHTRADGYVNSFGHEVSNTGHSYGSSNRYNGGNSQLGQSLWIFNGTQSTKIGLVDSEHTRNDGYKFSSEQTGYFRFNVNHQVIGQSWRYNGSGTHLGTSAWLFDGSNTIRMGYFDSDHTRSDGYRQNSCVQSNDPGQVIGYSYHYVPGKSDIGSTAWVYDGNMTHKIGFVDAEHTRSDGLRYNVASQITNSGRVVGFARRYNGAVILGGSVWLYDNTGTINIGLTGSEHTRNDNYRSSNYTLMNETGQVIGGSRRYNSGSADLGQTAWLYNGSNTNQIGLVDSEHTRNDAYRFSSAVNINQAGKVVGQSNRYNGTSSDLGQSAWYFNGNATTKIGLFDASHTRNDGFQNSVVMGFSNSEFAVGTSDRFSGGVSGRSAWVFNGIQTNRIGLFDQEHTHNSGSQYSDTIGSNHSAYVIGRSDRFVGGITPGGLSSWLFDGAATIKIGLFGPQYTRIDGLSSNNASIVNEFGQVAGFTRRYAGTTISSPVGQDAWYYDYASGQTFGITFSVRSSDSYAYSEISYVGDDGLAVGRYNSYDLLGNFLGTRAFLFSMSMGLQDLGQLVDGGLSANGWASLASAYRSSGGHIMGNGNLLSQPLGSTSFVASQSVPEPTLVWIFPLLFSGFVLARFRKGKKGCQLPIA